MTITWSSSTVPRWTRPSSSSTAPPPDPPPYPPRLPPSHPHLQTLSWPVMIGGRRWDSLLMTICLWQSSGFTITCIPPLHVFFFLHGLDLFTLLTVGLVDTSRQMITHVSTCTGSSLLYSLDDPPIFLSRIGSYDTLDYGSGTSKREVMQKKKDIPARNLTQPKMRGCMLISIREKKRRRPREGRCHAKTMMSTKANEGLK